MGENLTIFDCRREVLLYAILMERELRNNDHKPGWKDDSSVSLARRCQDEAEELVSALVSGESRERKAALISEEAADVGNMAMMVADVSGALSDIPDPAATMKEVVEVLDILARKEIPEKPQGNAGAYSIRHDEIRRARALLAKLGGE